MVAEETENAKHYKHPNSMGVGMLNPYSLAIDFSRQILSSKVNPYTGRVQILLIHVLIDVDP